MELFYNIPVQRMYMFTFFYVGRVIQDKPITTVSNTPLITDSVIEFPEVVDGGEEDVITQSKYT